MPRILPSKGKLLYHMTHLDNMSSILEKGLLPRKSLIKSQNKFTDIADKCIITKRERYKEALSKYVLFHFYARNPFDCAVCNKFGSKNMAIITLERKLHKKNDFFIIPSHPLDCEEPNIYPYNEGFQLIRWDILDMESGRDYNNSEIRKACLAECVMEYVIHVKNFFCIYVYDNKARQQIGRLANGNIVKIKVAPYMFP